MRPERFELPTCCSGGNRSIQLSYGRTVSSVYMPAGTGGNLRGEPQASNTRPTHARSFAPLASLASG